MIQLCGRKENPNRLYHIKINNNNHFTPHQYNNNLPKLKQKAGMQPDHATVVVDTAVPQETAPDK